MSFQLPARDDVVTRNKLERNARELPDLVCLSFEDGSTWTWRQALDEAYRAANVLRAAGVLQDDRVSVLLGNGADYFRAWWGTAVLGAVLAPLNTALRGRYLTHLLAITRPAVLVTDSAGMDILAMIDDPGPAATVPRLEAADLKGVDPSPPRLERPVELWDPAFMLATSGTTGPSKVSINSYLQAADGGAWFICDAVPGVDAYLCQLPLFHAGALWQAAASVVTGTAVTVRQRPNLRAFWEEARDSGATFGHMLSSMVPYLLGQPPRPTEKEHSLHSMVFAPAPQDVPGFKSRFGITNIYTGYGLSEVSTVLCDRGDDLPPSYVGKPRSGYECRLVDAHDIEVADGKPGELVVRSDQPWMITTEYVRNAEATVRSWRNGWFHTGDLMRRQGDRFFFVDRLTDSLRRRGENISAIELETDLLQHPSVQEVAVVPHQAPDSVEDEVKAFIVPVPGEEIDFEELVQFCVDRLPRYMIPRYFEVVEALPKTPSQKVMKYELKSRGNSGATWDMEAQGLRVTRNGLERT